MNYKLRKHRRKRFWHNPDTNLTFSVGTEEKQENAQSG
jgi:hypothetical protein